MIDKNCFDTKTLIKEVTSADTFELSCDDSPLCEILDFCADVKVTNCKAIKSCNGYKLIIKGIKIIKIRYVSKNNCGKIIYKKFILPFFDSIPFEPCVQVINIKATFSFYDIDIIDCNSIVFNNILCLLIKFSFKSPSPKIYCNTTIDNCDNDWHFKNDLYSSSFSKRNPIYSNSKCHPSSYQDCNYYNDDNFNSSNIYNNEFDSTDYFTEDIYNYTQDNKYTEK